MPTRRRLLTLATTSLLPVLTGRAARATETVERAEIVIPRHEALQDPQSRYLRRLLELAIERSGQPYTLQETPHLMAQARALLELTRPKNGIDLFWTMTDIERERHLLPIRVPLERGLIGWRLLLVRRQDLDRFAALRSLAGLAQLEAAQMGDWPDTTILRSNGLPVRTTSAFSGLFELLLRGRADYLPRSVLEIGPEAEAYAERGLVIEPRLLLHYPSALYIFVSPHRPQLHAHLSQGLEALVADGTLARQFDQQFGPLVKRYRLSRRQRLALQNPLLPPDTPLGRKELWFRL